MIEVRTRNNPRPGVLTSRVLFRTVMVGASVNSLRTAINNPKPRKAKGKRQPNFVDIALVSAKHSPRKMVQLLLDKHGANQLIDALLNGLEMLHKNPLEH